MTIYTKMTKNILDALEKGDKARDELMPGLYVQAGAKSKSAYYYYRFKKRDGTNIERRPKIGEWRVHFNEIHEMRSYVRKNYLEHIDRGLDPLVQQETARDDFMPSFMELYERYKKEHYPTLKENTIKNQEAIWNNHLIPRFRKLYVKQIQGSMIKELFFKIAKTRPTNANRVLEVIRKAFNYALEWEWVDKNPTQYIKKVKLKPRERYLSKDELSRFGEALAQLEVKDIYFCSLIKLLMYTGARLREIMHCEWEWLEGNTIYLPDSKTGAKQIILSNQALAILESIPKLTGNKFIFPSRVKRNTALDSPYDKWNALLKEAKIKDFRIHDLRHYTASVLAAEGYDLHVIGSLLGHTQYDTTRRYAKLLKDPLLEATNEAAKVIDKDITKK